MTNPQIDPRDLARATDEELLAALSADAAAFTEFYRRHVHRVRGVGVRRLGSAEEVADLVATVFLRVIESAHTFDPARGRAIPWLHAVAANVAGDELRRRERSARAQARLDGRRFWDPDDLVRIEEQMDAAASARTLAAAVRRLPDGERRLLELVVVDELSVAEAAAALGLRPGTARMRLSRARRQLRQELRGSEADAPPVPLPASLPRPVGAARPLLPGPRPTLSAPPAPLKENPL